MTNRIDIFGLGALNMDYLYQVDCILDDGEEVVSEARQFPGGSAANTIYGLAKLGVSVGFTGIVGSDPDGKILLKDLQKVGVDTSPIRTKRRAKTGAALCLTDKLGRRSLYIIPGANSLLSFKDLDLSYLNQAKVLHISSFVDDRQFQLLLKLVDRLSPSVKLSFAPGALFASRGLNALIPILAKTHVLFLNQSEVGQLTGENFVAGAEICLRLGCRIVAVTLGGGVSYQKIMAASYVQDASNEYVIEPAGCTEIADTTGAGDAYAAGFLYGLLNGKGLEECGRLGDIAAQFCIARMGARQGLPDLEQLWQRYQQIYGLAI